MNPRAASIHDPPPFTIEHRSGGECRRLRLYAGLTPELMAEIAGLPGRRAWMTIENDYEPIHPGCWALCLMKLGLYPEI